ncbi:MAG: hypothetical protein AB1632_05315, partial [Nitrospirota bacterium]
MEKPKNRLITIVVSVIFGSIIGGIIVGIIMYNKISALKQELFQNSQTIVHQNQIIAEKVQALAQQNQIITTREQELAMTSQTMQEMSKPDLPLQINFRQALLTDTRVIQITIDSRINNVLYCGWEVNNETSWKPTGVARTTLSRHLSFERRIS